MTKDDLATYDIISIVVNNYKDTQIKEQTIHLRPFESVVLEVKVKK